MHRVALLLGLLFVTVHGLRNVDYHYDEFFPSAKAFSEDLEGASSDVETATKDREDLSPNYKDPSPNTAEEIPEKKPKETPNHDTSLLQGGVIEVNAGEGPTGFNPFGGLPGFGKFPGLFSFGGLFGSDGPNFQPWWKGDHVCVEREESTDDEDKSNSNSSAESSKKKNQTENVFSTSISLSNCFETANKYECITKVNNHGIVKTFTVRYKCCYGYKRKEGASGCTEEVELKPLLDTINDVGGKEFSNLIKTTGLEDKFKNENITVFVPSDEALSEFTDRMLELNQVDVYRRRRDARNALSSHDLVLSHITPGFIDLNDLNNEDVLLGEKEKNSIRINAYPTKNFGKMITANCVRVTKENNLASNGIAHVVDGVIAPATQSLREIIDQHPQLTYFRRLLEKTDLAKNLKDDGHFTIFAPTDEGFNSLDEKTRQKIMRGEQCAKNIVKNHVILHTVCSSAIVGNATTHNVAGDSLNFERTDDGSIIIDGKAKIIKKDIVAKNGVIQLIDKILVPESALLISEILEKQNFTKFRQLIDEAGLTSEIDSSENATVFVPSDEALSQPEAVKILDSVKGDKQKLKELIQYHTIGKKLESCDMNNNQMIKTNDGEQELRLNLYSTVPLFANIINRATVNCARLIGYDEKACGSVVHEVNKILVPPTDTVFDIVNSNENYSTLAEIIKGTEAEEILKQSNQSITLVAPTNEAFEKLEPDDLKKLKDDKDKANVFVKNHILSEVLCCAGVSSQGWGFNNMIPTVSEHQVQISKNENGDIRVGKAQITECDNVATNGVVHTINRVLLPRRTRVPNIGFFLFDI